LAGFGDPLYPRFDWPLKRSVLLFKVDGHQVKSPAETAAPGEKSIWTMLGLQAKWLALFLWLVITRSSRRDNERYPYVAHWSSIY